MPIVPLETISTRPILPPRQDGSAERYAMAHPAPASTAMASAALFAQEATHRAKNMIQMASSMLQLQEDEVHSGEGKAALREARVRLLVLAATYETLLQRRPDGQRIDAAPLIAAIIHALREIDPRAARIGVRMECESLWVDAGTAVPLGLIVNEAVTNALKHGFAGRTTGDIVVRLRRSDSSCRLTIVDNGRGFIGPAHANSLGMRLMRSLARQLAGRLDVDGSAGTTVSLEWAMAGERQMRRGEL